MKPTINLYVDFEFTSLSPDAQIVSLGIVSDDIKYYGFDQLSDHEHAGGFKTSPKSFYAEFTDFQIERCDDWVKENVIKKLKHGGPIGENSVYGPTKYIKEKILSWLSQFSDYNIQFVVDCGTWDWYHLLQLISEWDEVDSCGSKNGICKLKDGKCPLGSRFKKLGNKNCLALWECKTGLPKLPANISPIPLDLNDLISIKKGISPKEAFELDREELAYGFIKLKSMKHAGFDTFYDTGTQITPGDKHNAIWDAKVIKDIYNKLK